MWCLDSSVVSCWNKHCSNLSSIIGTKLYRVVIDKPSSWFSTVRCCFTAIVVIEIPIESIKQPWFQTQCSCLIDSCCIWVKIYHKVIVLVQRAIKQHWYHSCYWWVSVASVNHLHFNIILLAINIMLRLCFEVYLFQIVKVSKSEFIHVSEVACRLREVHEHLVLAAGHIQWNIV